MKVSVIYCFPQVNPPYHYTLAKQFVDSYRQFPPDYPHELIVGINGMPSSSRMPALFDDIPHRKVTHDNTGWDIGLYQKISDHSDADLLVCFGAHIRFHRPNWLSRIIESFVTNGPGLYGPWGAQFPHWHIRTTAFWCPPPLLNGYPMLIGSSRTSRYYFEHGPKSITQFTLSSGFPAIMVTMEGCFYYPDWPNHIPDRNSSILLDKQHA